MSWKIVLIRLLIQVGLFPSATLACSAKYFRPDDALQPEEDKTSAFMVNGRLTTQGEFPFLVSFKTGKGICGGAIVNEFVVLTAAHCCNPDAKDVKAGSNDNTAPTQIHQIESQIVHEKFSTPGAGYDICLFKVCLFEFHFNIRLFDKRVFQVSTPFEFDQTVYPVRMYTNTNPTPPGVKVLAMGWGIDLASEFFRVF